MTITKLVKREFELFREKRRVKIGACIVIAFIPFLYAYTFLSSIWDPFQNLKNLPVAYVNLDQGTHFHKRDVRLGEDVTEEMLRRGDFRYLKFRTENEVRAAVGSGEVYFAIVF